MDTGLAGKGVVVTGASGGIGAACARLFAAEGANVLVHYHRGEERARAVAAEIGGAPIAQADLTVEADVDRLFATARETLGSVDVCAAVAGVWPAEDLPVWELPLERWEETMRQNLTATFLTARGLPARGCAHRPRLARARRLDRRALRRGRATPTTRQRSLRSRVGSCCR